MNNLITPKNFLKIFNIPAYRLKLDKMILNFWGLDTNAPLSTEINLNYDVVLEFNILLENNLLFKIHVKDTKNLFQSSKKFYLNFSLKIKNKSHELVIPNYWNIYCHYHANNPKQGKKILTFARIFQAKTVKELKSILMSLKIFSLNEINDIINLLK